MISEKIAVASSSFSKNDFLRKEILSSFNVVRFNDTGTVVSKSDLPSFLKGCCGAIIGLEKIDENVLDQLPDLRIISKYGVGLDNLDIKALERRNIYIGWTPGVNKRSVAELTLCFMLGLLRNIFFSGFKLKQGVWAKDGGVQLSEKTVGIIGCGNIGKELVQFLKAFGCPIIVNDIIDYPEFYKENKITPVSFNELLQQADVITLHVPLTDKTYHMISANEFEKMGKDTILINTSRGAIVDEQALKQALKRGRIRAAALDVFDPEPPSDQELLSLPNLMVTPHIGGNAWEAVLAMGRSAINHLVQYLK